MQFLSIGGRLLIRARRFFIWQTMGCIDPLFEFGGKRQSRGLTGKREGHAVSSHQPDLTIALQHFPSCNIHDRSPLCECFKDAGLSMAFNRAKKMPTNGRQKYEHTTKIVVSQQTGLAALRFCCPYVNLCHTESPGCVLCTDRLQLDRLLSVTTDRFWPVVACRDRQFRVEN